ncbi:MAG: FtsX-like permease family protein [Sphingobacteriales bacterium]
MLRHHLLIAFRNLKRHKGSFFINLIGLSTGLACALLIYLWVSDEVNFDKFHKKDKQLFQVMELSKENNVQIVHEHTQGLLADAMARDLPEVENAVSVMKLADEGFYFTLKTPDKAFKAAGIFASKGFFDMFSFKLKQGNAKQVMADRNSIVISEDAAKNLFGSADNVVGKSVEWEVPGTEKRQAQIAGVFEQLPANSSLKFDFVLTHDLLINEVWTNGQKWWNEGPATYLTLKEGTDIKRFNTKITDFIKRYNKDTQFKLFTRPYSSAYLYGKYENGKQAGGRIAYVKLFSVVALFILLIACINFMNLSTAKASRRLKEVGIKKTVGSSRKALVFQFLSEAVLMSFLSLMVACIIVILFLPVFNQVTGKQLSVNVNPRLIVLLLGATLLTGVLSGSYPAFYLSKFNPVEVLKGKIKNSIGEMLARKGLVVFQFMVSLVLIVAVMVIYRQVDFIQSKNLGYDKDNVIQFDKEGAVVQNTGTFLQELKQTDGIINASAISQSAVQSGNNASTYGIEWPGKTDKDLIDFVVRNVDYDMIETLGIQVKEGRSFSKQFGADSSKLIFNEAAIKVMGLKNPVGTKVKMWLQDMEIIGVVKDFHIASLHEAIAPMVFRYDPGRTNMIMAKIAAGKEKETISRLQSFYKKYNPGYVFDFKFLDNAYQAQYVSEQRVSKLSAYFAGLAILISCLGLFGLAAFNAEVRTKEIGIRKVLGASVSSMIYMLSKDFFKLVILAVLVAFPLAWWATNSWLSNFAYKINVGAGVFVIAFFVVLALTLLTVSFQAIKAAIANPVKSLRTE